MTTSPKVVSSTSNAEMRKIKKPLIERKRRERINHSLAELKMLVLEARNKDESCYSKMEKADILEMTVEHLKELQTRRLAEKVTAQGDTLHAFVTKDHHFEGAGDVGLLMVAEGNQSPKHPSPHLLLGYTECIQRVIECLESIDLKDSLRQSLIRHMKNQLSTRLCPISCSASRQPNRVNQKFYRNRKHQLPGDVGTNRLQYRLNHICLQNNHSSSDLDSRPNSCDRQRMSSFGRLFYENPVWRPWNAC